MLCRSNDLTLSKFRKEAAWLREKNIAWKSGPGAMFVLWDHNFFIGKIKQLHR